MTEPDKNRGPHEPEAIKTGGPPPPPPEDKPCATALHDLNEQVANLRLVVNALEKRVEELEERE